MPFRMNIRAPMRGGLTIGQPRAGSPTPMPQASPQPMAAPGGSAGFNERTGAYTRPVNPMINALRNPNVAMTGGAPTAGPGMLNGVLANIGPQFRKAEAMPMTTPSGPRAMTPQDAIAITSMANQRPVAMDEGFNPVTWMGRNTNASPQTYQAFNNQMAGRPDNAAPITVSPIPTNQRFEPTPPAPSFDRNAALQAFNNRAAEANKMFTNGLFGAGVSPDEFRNYQTNLRNLQLDQNSTQQQHEAALNDAMAFMNRVAPKPVEKPPVIPQETVAPAAAATFDPNAALNNFNANLARIYQGGGNMDMNMVRAQQANLRNLQLDRNATQEQHDAAYRNALSELRARYPDAFAG